MNIIIGKTSDDQRCLEKSFTALTSISDASIYSPCTVINPTLILAWNEIYAGYNYAQIIDWGKYYFITNVETQPGGKCLIYLKEDVLMTYKDQIKNLDVIVTRQQDFDKRLPFLQDGTITPQKDTVTHTIAFPPFSQMISATNFDNYFLTTIRVADTTP